MIAAGNLRERVTVNRRPTTQTVAADGSITDGTEEYCSRRAEVIPAAGVEKSVHDKLSAETTHLVRMRSDNTTRAITTAMWVTLSDSTRLDIVRVYDVNRCHIEVLLECKTRT